jgi:hypothetical protein
MPQFMLNRSAFVDGEPGGTIHPFYSLNTFAKGYVEAMFFTNGDTGDDREDLLNEWGVERLTKEATANIVAACVAFEVSAADLLRLAYERDGYSEEQAGRDLWFTSQGHGVGYWDRDQLEADELGAKLTKAAKDFGEHEVTAYRGWIYFR